MLVSVDDIIILYLVTLVCLSSGILTTKVSRDFQPPTGLLSPPVSYLPTTNTGYPKLSQHAVFVNRALDNGLEDVRASRGGYREAQVQDGYSYLKPLSIDLELPTKDQKIKLFTNKQTIRTIIYTFRSLEKMQSNHETVLTRVTESPKPISASTQRLEIKNHPYVPRQASYRVVEELDEYLMDDLDHTRSPYRGKVQTTNPNRGDTQDITTVIKALDHFLTGVLHDDGYNSELHPPPNPVLALILSRYGRYVLGARNPRVYAHMAVNNIHNNKPFGSYKLECEEVPTYVR
ncbi:uncharacterized protein LOC128875197 [Hylaeus volcanicus]|uniref:uncharacterized protein LOC128875197 n=1 Tax=Hylaeus volcanicus TaxID=313075 RepID=UPI0023B7FB27|nr:uncharacterized protein LOC128875197 [Hylaeus volcanicus]